MKADVAARAEGLLRNLVEAEGLELVHVEYQPRGAESILRIYIDKPAGVNLKDCERVSRQCSVLLDVEELIPHHYVLEVSSPGIERPLFKEADYRRFEGREVRLTTTARIDGRRKFTGFIEGLHDGVLHLRCESGMVEIPFSAIKKAHLVCRFE